MVKIILESMVDELDFLELPYEWNSFDLTSFSKDKSLWDYQQYAVKNSLKSLFLYYKDYSPSEEVGMNSRRKKKFFNSYERLGLEENYDFKLSKLKREIRDILMDYFEIENEEIPYYNFINRISFWMATGSGKTIIIIKLIQLLKKLMEYESIPDKDVLFLTCRDDLLNQFKFFVEEFNQGENGLKIILKNLKEFPKIKRNTPFLNEDSMIVYYYRSDNLSTEQKEKILDYKNYENGGNWYVFLDEAHKGDKEESKRQHLYSILSRNGFLFNSSATFIDPRDIITCIFEFNLSSFINFGYGKHLMLLKQELRAFKEKEDYTGEEKEKVVLKSLILFAYLSNLHEKLHTIHPDLYHDPLLLTLVNSVNIKDADLMVFFRVLKKIGGNKISDEVFNTALNELWQELKTIPNFIFETDKSITLYKKSMLYITYKDVLKHVYNSKDPGEIEVLKRPSNNKELVFKLKTSSIPFALIKIGDISGWLKSELLGYEIQDTLFEESYFEKLNENDSHIKILMGSRSFYEGWDSNRPNVINYVNIGVGKEARKFILQSVGRGIRIEPMKNKRKRLNYVASELNLDFETVKGLQDIIEPIETLFIFSTNRKSLLRVIETLNVEKKKVKPKILEDKLEITSFKEKKQPRSFELSLHEHEELMKYLNYLSDDRIFLMKFNVTLKELHDFKAFIGEITNFKIIKKRKYLNPEFLIQNLFDFLTA